MAAKKSSPKKVSSKKASAKKTVTKKTKAKQSVPQKAALKKILKAKKIAPKKIIPERDLTEIVPPDATEEFPTTGDCMCRQKKPNGKFFCFKLIQGRWVQSSVIPFPTKELCEEVNC